MGRAEHVETIYTAIAQLQRLAQLFAERRQQLARRVGLTEREWEVLEEVSTQHFMPSMFARKCEQTPAAVSKMLRQLLDKELVRVSIAENDGRQRSYELTPRGRSLMDRLRAERERAIAAIWKDLPDEQLRSFNALSEQLIARIEAYAGTEKRKER